MKTLATTTAALAILTVPMLSGTAHAQSQRLTVDESGTQVSMRSARSGATDLETLGADGGFVVFRNPQGGFFRMRMTDLCDVDPSDFINDENAERAITNSIFECG